MAAEEVMCCVLVSGTVGLFSVKIGGDENITALKNAIKNGSDRLITAPAPTLQLFLAKTEDGAWVSSSSEDITKLMKGEKTALIEALTKEDQELRAGSLIAERRAGKKPHAPPTAVGSVRAGGGSEQASNRRRP
ncbi:unnamed protein product [Phytophthora fragariaefolia]|uniref:Unnamed protein product n=1 Tax=Phytophthora fragariaefolia TaxID=1490495 RepID=A0A9W6TWG0_9STRA|nr:unnamed protein product [Phytophthora fragariaefolia]